MSTSNSRKKIHTYVTLIRQAFGEYYHKILILTGLAFLSGLLEGLGVNTLIPILSFFTGEGEGGEDFISQAIEKFFLFLGVDFSLLTLLIFISLLFIFKAFARLLFNYVRITIRADYEKQTRSKLYTETLQSTWPHLLQQKLGYLETVIMTDVRASAKLFDVISNSIMAVSGLVVYLFFAINISPFITLASLAVGGILFFVLKPLAYRIRAIAKKTAFMNKEIARTVNESILGMKVIKSMFAERPFVERGDINFEQLKNMQVRMSLLRTLAIIFIQPLSVIFIAVVFALSYYSASLQFAGLVALIYLINRIFSYIQTLQSNVHNVSNLFPYLEQVLTHQEQALYHRESDEADKPFQFRRTLSLRNISFVYEGGDPVLRDISLSIKKGEMVGFIGLSGSGKTTLFDLILRLFIPTTGAVLVDDTNAAEISFSSWRNHVGSVAQDLFLTNDTITNNIAFYNDTTTQHDAEEAARMAHIYDFIMTLPDGFETIIGERGLRLSTGQRQRIAIARALVRKPDVLLLDEATSALDNESEWEVQKVIEKLKGAMTILVVAHRLSTVMNADKLFVLAGGKIVESGPPRELLENKDSYFYKVYNIRT